MPELPDIEVYVETLALQLAGRTLARVCVANPFLVRTFDPPLAALGGKRLTGTARIGKRIVLAFTDDLFVVIHLMVAGRLRWLEPGAKAPGRIALATFEFDNGNLVLTEAGSKRRASVHLVRGAAALAQFNMGGLEVFGASLKEFAARLRVENHTLKRALTDPHLFSGIGNAYSDEILHRARLSPLAMSAKLDAAEIACLHAATLAVLAEWSDRLRADAAGALPEKVTAFRPEMAVHGKFGKPCPVCGSAVQRIVYADNETNYCARCQTGGRVLADRALSRLLKASWPRSIDELG